MKEESKISYSRKVTIRFKQEEYNQIHKKFKASTGRKLSEYIRKMILGKPLVLMYRNQSADEFLAETVKLKSELNPSETILTRQ
jgi:hypothetical protein